MKLLPGEQIILESDNGVLVLTSCRVRYQSKTAGYQNVISIMLNAVSAVGIERKSHPMLIILGLISIIGGWVEQSSKVYNSAGSEYLALGLIIAAAFSLVYWFTSRQFIWVASSGARLNVPAHRMRAASALEFINEVEAAVLAYDK